MAQGKPLELSIRIAGQVDKSLTSALTQAQNQVSSFSRGLSTIGTIGLAAMGTLFTGTAAFIVDSVQEAEDFEAKMANVVKYVDGLADEQGMISPDKVFEGNGETYAENYNMVKEAILDLSTQIPYTAEELTELAAAAGQSGKSMSDLFQIAENGEIDGFLKDAAMLGTAWDIDAGLAGDYAAKWEKAFNMSHDDVMRLADQINYLGANSATTAAEIANTVNKAGSLGQVAGVDVATTAALADAMLATGVNTDRAGTALKNIFTRMSLGESATDKTKAQWMELGFTAEGIAKSMQRDSIATTKAVFEAINNLPDYRRMAAIKELFGMWSAEGAAKIANNMSTYIDALNMVSDPSLYEGSMLREFNIKTNTTASKEMMMESSLKALKDSIGTEFLPVKAQVLDMLTTVFNELRKHTPELTELAGTLADLAGKGVSKLGDALDVALPKIQQGLDYVVNNGEQVASIIGGLALAFAAMKAAPVIETVMRGAGTLMFGSGTMGGGMLGTMGGMMGTRGATGNTGGGLIQSLWKAGGQMPGMISGAAGKAGQGIGVLASGARMGVQYNASGRSGLLGTIADAAMGIFGAGQNMKGFMNPKTVGNAAANLASTLSWAGNTGGGGGLLGMIGQSLKGTRVGNYAGSVSKAAGGVLNNPIVSGIGGALGQAGGFVGQGFKGLGQGFAMLGSMGFQKVKGGVGNAAGSFLGMMGNSKVGQGLLSAGGAVKSGIGAVMPFAKEAGGLALGAGKNILGLGGGIINTVATAAGPITGIFTSIISSALPIVGIISSIIAVVSILGDNLDGIRNIVQSVFGEQGVAVFDAFTGKIQEIGTFIQSLFGDGLINLMAPFQETITNMFGADAGAAFGGLTEILQSVMNIVQELVNFSITYVKPIIESVINYVVNTAMPLVLQTFTACAPFISQILTQVGSMILRIATIIAQAITTIQPYLSAIVTGVLTFISGALPNLLEAISNICTNIGRYIEDLVQIFTGLIDFIVGVFTGNWELAWQGVVEVFGGVFNAVVDLGKSVINAVIGVINTFIGGINAVAGMVPASWGGGFAIPEIPYLARGGFTNGPSIAGEAGTEAVISFQTGVRSQNIATWAQAGRMLGVDSFTEAERYNGFNSATMPDASRTQENRILGADIFIEPQKLFGFDAVSTPSTPQTQQDRTPGTSIFTNIQNLFGTDSAATPDAPQTQKNSILNTNIFTESQRLFGFDTANTQNVSRTQESRTPGADAFAKLQRLFGLDNIATSEKLLGLDSITTPGELELADIGNSYVSDNSPVTFSPQITINGNADDGVMDRALAKMRAEFETMYYQMERRKARTRY